MIPQQAQATGRVLRLKKAGEERPSGISTERAKLVTQAYRQTEGKPILLRRALALAYILENQTITIYPDELIVGNHCDREGFAPLFPEIGIEWVKDEMVEQKQTDNLVFSPEDEKALLEILPYWQGKTFTEHVLNGLPEDVLAARADKLFHLGMHEDSGLGHMLADFETVLQVGLGAMGRICEEYIGASNPAVPEEYEKILLWQAAKIVLEGTSRFIRRYSELAREMAKTETDAQRKEDLSLIAGNCENIAVNPARTFYEGVQLVYFVQTIIQIETNGSSVSIGRFDQFMHPYYRADRIAGRLDLERAQELIDCFYLKLSAIFKARPVIRKSFHAGVTRFQNLTVGGVDAQGQDATNDLSYLCLEARDHCKTVDPQMSLRVHGKTPSALLLRAAKLLRKGGGHPALFSDEVIIPALLTRGVSLAKARDYSIIGCVEVAFVGLWGRNDGGYTNMVKALELAVNDAGQEPMQTYEDFYARYEQVLDHVITLQTVENNWIDQTHERLVPHVFASCFTPGCLASGKDVTAGGADYNWTAPMGVGLANVANSLYAIKKLIYEDREFSIEQLQKVLKNNWEGQEDLRRRILDLPKYGNDEEEVDALAAAVADSFYDSIEKQVTHRKGAHFVPALYSLTANVPLGWATGATADGREAFTPLSEGISPAHGTDVNGPTAVLKSVGRVDWVRATGGVILNQKFSPALLGSDAGLQRFVEMIKAYLQDLQGAQIQFNIVSKEELIEAQEHPENHKDLIVRVTGYSARFVDLSRAIQDDIISRTEHVSF